MALHLYQLKKKYIGPDGSIVSVVDIDSFALADGELTAENLGSVQNLAAFVARKGP